MINLGGTVIQCVIFKGKQRDIFITRKEFSGLSKIRSKGIAAVFSYMNIIEAWGSGIPRMFSEIK